MNNNRQHILINFLVALLLLAVSSQFLVINANAQTTTGTDSNISKGIAMNPQMLKITPAIMEMTLIPGQTQTFLIKVENLRDEPVGLSGVLQGFDATDEDTGISFETPRSLNGIPSWGKLSFSESILNPKSTTELILTITTPPATKNGSYPALILLTPFVTRPLSPSLPKVVSKVALPVFAHVGKIESTSLKENVSIPTFSFDQAKRTITLRVTNNNPTMINTKPFLSIHAIGRDGAREQLVEKHVLPSHTRRWIEHVTLPDHFPYFYTAKIDVSVGGGEYISKTLYFTTLPLNMIIVVLIFIILAIVLFLSRKRLKKAGKALINN